MRIVFIIQVLVCALIFTGKWDKNDKLSEFVKNWICKKYNLDNLSCFILAII